MMISGVRASDDGGVVCVVCVCVWPKRPAADVVTHTTEKKSDGGGNYLFVRARGERIAALTLSAAAVLRRGLIVGASHWSRD